MNTNKCSRTACQVEIPEGQECVHGQSERLYCKKCAMKINMYHPHIVPQLVIIPNVKSVRLSESAHRNVVGQVVGDGTGD